MRIRDEGKPAKHSRVPTLTLLVTLASYVAVYTAAVYQVAYRWACGSGRPSIQPLVGLLTKRENVACWTCAGSIDDATFFPWPRGPLGVCAEVIKRMNPVDEFIYLYLIEMPILVFFSILLWTIVTI